MMSPSVLLKMIYENSLAPKLKMVDNLTLLMANVLEDKRDLR